MKRRNAIFQVIAERCLCFVRVWTLTEKTKHAHTHTHVMYAYPFETAVSIEMVPALFLILCLPTYLFSTVCLLHGVRRLATQFFMAIHIFICVYRFINKRTPEKRVKLLQHTFRIIALMKKTLNKMHHVQLHLFESINSFRTWLTFVRSFIHSFQSMNFISVAKSF